MKVRSRIIRMSAAVAAVVSVLSSAHARNLTWDSNDITAPLGNDGFGSWDLVTSNWVDGDLITGTNTTWLNSPADSAIFGNATTPFVPASTPNDVDLADNITVQDVTLGVGTNGSVYNISDFNGGSLTVQGNITKASDSGFNQFLLVSGPLTLTSGTHTFAINDSSGDSQPELSMNGAIAGAGDITIDNGAYVTYGTVAFNVDNSYTGTTNINKGRLIITTSGALGSTAGGTVISNLGTLSIGGGGTTVVGGLTIAEPITIKRDTYAGGDAGDYPYAIFSANGSGTHNFTGPFVVDSTDARISANTSTIIISSAITEGPTVTPGSSVISFTGDYAGFVQLTADNSAYPGTFRLIDHVEVQPANQNAIGGPSSKIEFTGDATLQPPTDMLNFGTHVVNYTSFSGGIDVPLGQTFTVDHALSGGAGLGQHGAGTLNINSTVSGTGAVFWDGVTIGGAKNGIVNVNAAVTMGSLHLRSPIVNINSGGSVTTNGGFNSFGSDSTGTNGTPDMAVVNLNGTGQFIQTTGDDFNISDNANTQGTINVHDNAVLTTGGVTFLGKSAGATGTINQDGGTVNINRGGNFSLVVADGRFSDGPTGVYTMSGSTSILNVAGEMYVGEGHTNTAHATGSFTMSGGTANLHNWFVIGREGGVGTVDISGGTVNHTGGNTSIGDSAGGTDMMTLRGTAQYLSTAGEFWVGTGGNSVGTLIMKDSAVLTVTDWFPVGRNGALGTLDMSGNASITKTGGNNSYIGERLNNITSTMTVRGNSNFTAASGEFWVGQGGGSGILNIQDTASFTVSNWLAIGRADGASIGVVNLSGGTLTKTIGSGGFLAVGSGGSGTFNQTGGTLNADGTRVGEASSGTMNLSGGTATFTGEFSLGYNGGLIGTLNISNTANVTVPNVIFGVNAANAAFGGQLNLNGGTLTGTSFTAGASATALRKFVFNGGTLLPAADNTNFIGAKVTSVVSTGGALINSNNHAITIGSALTHDTTLPGADGGLTKSGLGTVTLNGINTYTGNTTVTAGKLILGANSLVSPVMNAQGARIEVGVGNNKVLKTGTLNPTAGGQIDLQDNKAIVTGQSVATVTALVLAGRNGGTWDGANGIITSQTNALATHSITTLAVAAANAANVHKTTFGGVPVTNETLVMYTYNGDANLDGRVDADDYFIIDSNLNKSGTATGFNNGDFNYDGQINGDDYFAIDSGYTGQGARLSTGSPVDGLSAASAPAASLDGVSAVPEPASIGLLGLAAAGLMRRRRREAQ